MRRRWSWQGVILLSLAATVSAAERKVADHEVRRADQQAQLGQRALSRGDAARAETHFRKAAAILPGFPDAHLGLGHVAMTQRRFEDALEAFRRGLDSYATLGEALFELRCDQYASAQKRVSELRDEINQLRMPSVANKLRPTTLEMRINSLEEQIRELESLEPPSRESVSEPPGQIHFFIGNALFNLNRLDEARAEWERCREKSPKFSLAYNNLAVVYWKLGRLAEAREMVERAEALGHQVNPAFKADLDEAERP